MESLPCRLRQWSGLILPQRSFRWLPISIPCLRCSTVASFNSSRSVFLDNRIPLSELIQYWISQKSECVAPHTRAAAEHFIMVKRKMFFRTRIFNIALGSVVPEESLTYCNLVSGRDTRTRAAAVDMGTRLLGSIETPSLGTFHPQCSKHDIESLYFG